jgi:hypothetical protein
MWKGLPILYLLSILIVCAPGGSGTGKDASGGDHDFL